MIFSSGDQSFCSSTKYLDYEGVITFYREVFPSQHIPQDITSQIVPWIASFAQNVNRYVGIKKGFVVKDAWGKDWIG